MLNLTINPYIAIGDIEFGMSSQEVEKILGKPYKTENVEESASSLAGLQETLKDCVDYHYLVTKKNEIILSFKNGKLLSALFKTSFKQLQLGELNLLENKIDKTIQALEVKSENIFLSDESYYFLDYGITVYIPEYARTYPFIEIFSKNYYDSFIQECLDEDFGKFIKGGFVK